MNPSKLDRDSQLIAAGGLLLLLLMFLPWFRTAPESNPFIAPARVVTLNAWEAFALIDLIIAATGIAAIVVVVLAAREGEEQPSIEALGVFFALAALSTILIVYRVIDPIENTDSRWGAWVALLVVLGLAYLARDGGRWLIYRSAELVGPPER